MKTIKIIDLLNKIANGEEVPRKIHYQNDDFTLTDTFKNYIAGYNDLLEIVSGTELNDEVEILDEEDEFEDIEHYDMFDYFEGYDFGGTNKELLGNLQTNFEHINNELDNLIKNQKKIIEKLNKLNI